jgi:hypothetical protein
MPPNRILRIFENHCFLSICAVLQQLGTDPRFSLKFTLTANALALNLVVPTQKKAIFASN